MGGRGNRGQTGIELNKGSSPKTNQDMLIRNNDILIRNQEILISYQEILIRNQGILMRNQGILIRNPESLTENHDSLSSYQAILIFSHQDFLICRRART